MIAEWREALADQPMTVFEFAGHTLDLKQGRLRNGAGDVALRPKSLALLIYLVRNPGRVIDKHELIEAIWPDVIVSDDSLTQCLKDIRVALGPQAEGFIRTLPRRGYILDEARLRSYGENPPAPWKLQSTAEKPSIAVLPFETAGADQEWFSDGIAEDITTALTKRSVSNAPSARRNCTLRMPHHYIVAPSRLPILATGRTHVLGWRARWRSIRTILWLRSMQRLCTPSLAMPKRRCGTSKELHGMYHRIR